MNSNLKHYVLINNFYKNLKYKLFKNNNEINLLHREISHTCCQYNKRCYFAKIDSLESQNENIIDLLDDIELYYLNSIC
mgnify:CR=1 FL=1